MASIATYSGVVRDGKIELADKIALPEGIEVFVVVPTVIDEAAARRKANVWLLENIGNLVIADQPRLINLRSQLIWHFKALSTASKVEPIGNVLLNAMTGQVLSDNQTVRQILENAQNLKHSILSPAS